MEWNQPSTSSLSPNFCEQEHHDDHPWPSTHCRNPTSFAPRPNDGRRMPRHQCRLLFLNAVGRRTCTAAGVSPLFPPKPLYLVGLLVCVRFMNSHSLSILPFFPCSLMPRFRLSRSTPSDNVAQPLSPSSNTHLHQPRWRLLPPSTVGWGVLDRLRGNLRQLERSGRHGLSRLARGRIPPNFSHYPPSSSPPSLAVPSPPSSSPPPRSSPTRKYFWPWPLTHCQHPT